MSVFNLAIQYIFVYKQCYLRYDIVPISHQNNKKMHHNERKKMSLLQKDRLNFQKIHQIARLVDHNDRVTMYTIPWIIKWLKMMELMETMT
jgi:regulatory protein YycH of two-component signal transduction system YycFG